MAIEYPFQTEALWSEEGSWQMYGPGIMLPSLYDAPTAFATLQQLPSPRPQTQPILALPKAESLRMILTDDYRKEICQYHEDNPSAKQGDIGSEIRLESGLLHFANFCYRIISG